MVSRRLGVEGPLSQSESSIFCVSQSQTRKISEDPLPPLPNLEKTVIVYLGYTVDTVGCVEAPDLYFHIGWVNFVLAYLNSIVSLNLIYFKKKRTYSYSCLFFLSLCMSSIINANSSKYVPDKPLDRPLSFTKWLTTWLAKAAHLPG